MREIQYDSTDAYWCMYECRYSYFSDYTQWSAGVGAVWLDSFYVCQSTQHRQSSCAVYRTAALPVLAGLADVERIKSHSTNARGSLPAALTSGVAVLEHDRVPRQSLAHAAPSVCGRGDRVWSWHHERPGRYQSTSPYLGQWWTNPCRPSRRRREPPRATPESLLLRPTDPSSWW